MLVDTHVHLCDSRYDEDRAAVLKRAREAGITGFINIGAELEEVRRVAAFSEAGVKGAIGLHPHYIESLNDEVYAEFEGMLKNSAGSGIAAVGEIGLDYFKSPVSREVQLAGFKRMLLLARAYDRSVVIHSRDAHDDVYEELKANGPEKKGVIHCFTAGINEAKKFTDLGYMLGIGGVITFPNAGALREAVREIPAEFLVLETDAPWLAPQGMRGKRNEPAFMAEVARAVAELKGMSYEEVCEITTNNAGKVFGA